MSKERITGIIQLILVLAIIFGSFAISKFLERSYEPPKKNSVVKKKLFVKTKYFSPQNYHLRFVTNGVVRARNRIKITPEVSGRVIMVNENFYNGGNFQKDDILFQIDPRDYILNLEKAEAEIAKMRVEYKLEKARAQSAIIEWQAVSDKPIPELVARKPQLKAKMASLKAAKADFKNIALDLKRTSFSLPFSGKIISSEVSVGQYLNAANSYGEVISDDFLEIKSSLDEKELEILLKSKNPKIIITINNKKYQGFLKRKAGNIDLETRFSDVYFGFKDKNITEILDGDFVTIEVQGQKLKNVTAIDIEALQNGEKIFSIENNQLKKLDVEIVNYQENKIIVRGINKKTKIVISRINGGYEGIEVKEIDE